MEEMFNQQPLTFYFNEREKSLRTRIEKLDIPLEADIERIKVDLYNEFLIQPFIINTEPDIGKEYEEEYVETIMNHHKQTHKLKCFDITLSYTGDKELFTYHPSRASIDLNPLQYKVLKNKIISTIKIKRYNSNEFKQEIENLIRKITQNIPEYNKDIKRFNENLTNIIDTHISQRIMVLSERENFYKEIGLVIKNPTTIDFTNPDPVKKKVIPKYIPQKQSIVNKEIEPKLNNLVYNDIIDVLFNVGTAFERKPSLYKDKGEEDLRDMFLLFLETRYDSISGVGEAFNKKGKTDILLKHTEDGSNVFVAECKIWHGIKKFNEAIDQLLSYLTLRDTKTSLMIFVQKESITNVLQTIDSQIESHSNCSRKLQQTYETSNRYAFTLPQDQQKEIIMEVMLFYFPKN